MVSFLSLEIAVEVLIHLVQKVQRSAILRFLSLGEVLEVLVHLVQKALPKVVRDAMWVVLEALIHLFQKVQRASHGGFPEPWGSFRSPFLSKGSPNSCRGCHGGSFRSLTPSLPKEHPISCPRCHVSVLSLA